VKQRLNSWIFLTVLLMMVALLSACAPQQPVALPTVALLPTDTATYTPSVTLTASDTPTPLPTHTPYHSPTPKPTVTETLPPADTGTISPTASFTPSRTFTPSNTPLPTNTFTATYTFTPSPSFTPTVLPLILTFTADLPSVQAGSQDLLRWQTANADTVTLDLLTASGTLVSSNKTDPGGQQLITLTPDLGNTVIYRITAKTGKNTASKSITITIQCAVAWFFAPAPSGCAGQASTSAAFKYQSLERAIAFYIPTTNNVYILANDGNRVNAYPMDWNYQPLPVLPPPGNLIQPTVEIGYIWLHKPWSNGGHIADVLGWATSAQIVYNGVIQPGGPGELYFKGPSGAVYKLSLAGVGTWSIVGNAP